MTPSVIELRVSEEDRLIARLTAMAVGLAVVDAAIPSPVPGIKPGLANIVTLLVLLKYGWHTAAWVTGLRVVASALLLGQIFSPGFFLSLSGALCSLAVLAMARHLPTQFGPVSLSLLGAFAHLAGQMALARLWLIPHDGLYFLFPVLGLSALVFGTLNGLITCHLLQDPAFKDDLHA